MEEVQSNNLATDELDSLKKSYAWARIGIVRQPNFLRRAIKLRISNFKTDQ